MRKVERQLRERLKVLQKELDEVKRDREQFRSYWVGKMKWFIELQGKGTSTRSAWMIEDLARLFNRVERWYW